MSGILSQASKCLYCVWPALVGGIGWWLCRIVEHKTYYNALTVGVDPVSPQGQEEFNTRRLRDAEKRRTIYWTIGIILVGYLIVLAWNTFTIKTKAAPVHTPTPTSVATSTLDRVSITFIPSPSSVPATLTTTITPGTLTYAPTATDRVIYIAGPKVTVIVTVVVERIREVTAKPTRTSTPTATLTPTPTYTSSPTLTPTCTIIPTPTASETATASPSPTFIVNLTPAAEAVATATSEPTQEVNCE